MLLSYIHYIAADIYRYLQTTTATLFSSITLHCIASLHKNGINTTQCIAIYVLLFSTVTTCLNKGCSYKYYLQYVCSVYCIKKSYISLQSIEGQSLMVVIRVGLFCCLQEKMTLGIYKWKTFLFTVVIKSKHCIFTLMYSLHQGKNHSKASPPAPF